MKKENLNEVKLARVFKHTTNDKIPFAIITGERAENRKAGKPEINVKKNLSLASEIKSAGYGYFWLEGHWIENEGKPNETPVTEKSIFIVGDENDDGKLEGLIKKWVKKYDQESAVFRHSGSKNVGLINNNGSFIEIGKFAGQKKQLDNIYSKLKNKTTFVFEREIINYESLTEANRLL